MKKIFLAVVVFLIVLLLPLHVSALTAQELQQIDSGTEYYQPSQVPCYSSTTTLVGNDNVQKAYNFFIQKGLSNVQAAAIVGNLVDESNVNPTDNELGGTTPDPNTSGNKGWGIAQWTPGSKIFGIAQALNITTPIDNLSTQLNIVYAELKGTSPTGTQNMLTRILGMHTLSNIVTYFQVFFEGGVPGQRQQDASNVLQLYGGSSNSGSLVGSNTVGYNFCTSSIGSAVNCQSPSTTSTLDSTRRKIVCIAENELALWESQPNYNQVPFPFAANGYLKYTQGLYEEWCAAFVSWVYNQAGDPLSTPNWLISGVSSIKNVPASNTSFSWHPASSGYVPQPGDIAILPDHATIFISSTAGVSTYIGGDQGHAPYGALSPTRTPPKQNSESIVSEYQQSGYYSGGILGYVSPN